MKQQNMYWIYIILTNISFVALMFFLGGLLYSNYWLRATVFILLLVIIFGGYWKYKFSKAINKDEVNFDLVFPFFNILLLHMLMWAIFSTDWFFVVWNPEDKGVGLGYLYLSIYIFVFITPILLLSTISIVQKYWKKEKILSTKWVNDLLIILEIVISIWMIVFFTSDMSFMLFPLVYFINF